MREVRGQLDKQHPHGCRCASTLALTAGRGLVAEPVESVIYGNSWSEGRVFDLL
jgi:hypothetical protein